MSGLQWAAFGLAVVLMVVGLVVMVVGVGVQLRALRTQLRQEWRPPATSSDPALAQRAQEILDDLCAKAGERPVVVTVVPILGRPTPSSAAGLGTGGPAVTRFRINQPASILLASGAGVLSRAGLQSLLAHELAHAAAYASRRSVLRHYAAVVPFFLTVPLMIWVALAVSISVALPVAALAATVLLAWWTSLSRRQEIAADLYAIDLTGDLDGATELMDLYISARTEKRHDIRLVRTFEAYFETHPSPEARLAIMAQHLTGR